MLNRRSMLTGIVGLIAAPAIVRASSLMPIRVLDAPWTEGTFAEWYPWFIRMAALSMEPGAVNHLRFEGSDNPTGPFAPLTKAIKPLGNGVFSMPDCQFTLITLPAA